MNNDSTKIDSEFLRAVFESTSDGILVIDQQQTNKIVAKNRAVFDIFDVPSEFWDNEDDTPMLQHVTALNKDPEQFYNLVQELYAYPERKSYDMLELKNGKKIDRYSSPVYSQGKIIGRLWFFRDVTDKIDNEARMVNSAKMATLGEMAASVAHEINNPITVIKGYSAKIKKELSGESFDKENILTMLTKIDSTVTLVSKIIRSLKNYSRDASSDPFENKKLKDIFEEVLQLVNERIIFKEVKLTISEIPEVTINCRFTELVQTFINLIGNSIDAIADLEDKWIKLDIEKTTHFICIKITDSGAGIPKDIQEKIFQPFFTTKEVGKGTGLGLSLSYKIIKNHGGVLSLNSQSANTQFIVELPYMQG